MDETIIILMVLSTLSVVSSLLVVLTPILFVKMRHKLLCRIVAFISFGDILGNIPYVFPYRPNTGSSWCTFEAFLNMSGYPMEWLWTTVLVYLLFQLANRGKISTRMGPFHILCWGLPTLLTLLMLTFSHFEKNNGAEVCRIQYHRTPFYYHVTTYYGMFFSSVFLQLLLYGVMHIMERAQDERVRTTPFKVAKEALTLYPMAMIIFWLPHSIAALSKTPSNIYVVFLFWKILHGFAVSVIFFRQSTESRKQWYRHVLWPLQNALGHVFICIKAEPSIVDLVSIDSHNSRMSEIGSGVIDVDDVLDLLGQDISFLWGDDGATSNINATDVEKATAGAPFAVSKTISNPLTHGVRAESEDAL